MNANFRKARPFVVVGGLAVVAGGLTSAITAFSPSYLASWVVAYVVLVGGVAQIILGLGQASFSSTGPTREGVLLQVVLFNLGNAFVLAGSLLETFVLSVVGSVLLVAVLAWMARSVWRSGERGPLQYGYFLVLGILAVSIPIGLVIAGARI